MMEIPRVSILILNFNGLNDTIECLESLKRIDYPNYEIVIVDNGSKGNDIQILSIKYSNQITIIENNKNLGFAEGNNVGIRKILSDNRSKYIMFLNNDTTVEKDFLSKLLKRAETDKSIGIIGPEIRFYKNKDKIHSRGGVINLFTGWHFVGGTYHRHPYKEDSKFRLHYFSGAAFMMPVRVIREIKGFDPQYFYYTEDVDLGYRVFQKGYKIKCEKSSIIYHKEGMSVGGNIRNPKTAYFETRNALLFIRKHGNLHQKIIFTGVLFVKMLYDFILFFKFEKITIWYRLKGIMWHFFHRVQLF